MIPQERKVKNWKEILRKLREQRDKRMKQEELAAKREEEKYRKEERDFRMLLKRDADRTNQMMKVYMSKLSKLEKKLDRIIQKNKLKS